MATVFWDSEGIVLTDYLEHGRTITGTYYADLIRKCREALKEKRRGKLRRGVPCHHLLIRHHKHWPPPKVPVSNCCTTHRIWQTSICCKTEKNHGKMEIYWRQWRYLHRKWLAGGPTSRIHWHTGFGESLDQVHFCRRELRWEVTKYHAHILLLTISGYELFERPSYFYGHAEWY